MASIRRDILFQTQRLKLVRQAAANSRGDTVCVTFTTWRPDPKTNLDQGFAEGVFLKHGIDEILVQNGRNDWYQSGDIAPMLQCLTAALASYDTVISYGASMGGYACLNFSNILRARRAIAVSPQISVDPAKVPFETRWQRDTDTIRFTRDNVNGSLHPGTRHVVLFDPRSRDAGHARLIDDAWVQKIGLRHSGHFTLNTIKDLGLLGAFVGSVLLSDGPVDDFAALYHRRIRQSPWRVLSLAERSIRAPGRFMALWRRFCDAPPADPIPFEKMALFLILARYPAEALDTLDALEVLQTRPYALSLRARALANLGDAAAARAHAVRVTDMVGPGHDYAVQLRSLGIAA